MSTFRVDVVRIGALDKHPNADTLSITKVWNYTCVIRTSDWAEGDLAAYIEPDNMVPTERDTFKFLHKEGRTEHRVKTQKFRGVMSQGLLVRAPEGSKEGDDVSTELGVTHYEPPEPANRGSANRCRLVGGEVGLSPSATSYKYDLESWFKYGRQLVDGEHIIITEKLHGCNARFVFDTPKHPKMDQDNGPQMFCGSRTEWKRQDEGNLWWRALAQNPWIENLCRTFPGYVFYGECFGQVQDLKYDTGPGQYRVRLFDMLKPDGMYANWEDVGPLQDVWVPVLYDGPYSEAKVRELMDGKSTLASHIREGIVIGTAEERYTHAGRMKLKAVSPDYLSRNK